jgi:hypothetical protein
VDGLGRRRYSFVDVCDRKCRPFIPLYLTILTPTLLQIIEAAKIASQNSQSYQSWIRKIARETGALPPTFVLKGVTRTSNYAVSGGGFSDIYVGVHRGRVVALKVLRVFMTTENRKRVFRVRYFD